VKKISDERVSWI